VVLIGRYMCLSDNPDGVGRIIKFSNRINKISVRIMVAGCIAVVQCLNNIAQRKRQKSMVDNCGKIVKFHKINENH